MPIRRELRHFYRGPAWKATRERIIERAKSCCEQCQIPNGWTGTRIGGNWWDFVMNSWRSAWGEPFETPSDFFTGPAALVGHDTLVPRRIVTIVLTIAHLDHTPGHDDDANLKALCQWCHLNYDKLHHKETRSERKDGARPLLQEAPCS